MRSPPDTGIDEIVERLRAVVVEQSDGTLTAADVLADDELFDAGHLDSMGAAALLAFVEDEYDVAIEEIELSDRLRSLAALAAHIAGRGQR